MNVVWPDLLLIGVGLLIYLPTIMVDAALALAVRNEIVRAADGGQRSAQIVARTLSNRRRWVVSAMLLRVAGLLMVGAGLTLLSHHVQPPQPLWVWVLVALACWLGLVFLQLSLRLLVQRNPNAWALRLAPGMQAVMTLLSPITRVLHSLSEPLRFGFSDEEESILLSDDGARLLLPADGEESEIEDEEKEMIASILEMNETVVREVMVPRTSMVAIDVETAVGDAVATMLKAGHSRIPVYEESVDQIIGLVYAKDLLRAYAQDREDSAIRDLLRPAYFVPLTKKARVLLSEMQKQRVHIAIVVDEYGGTSGLVTIEDILEEIVGEIQDEYDSAEEVMTQSAGEGVWVVNGRLDLYTLGKLLGRDFDDEEADTVGGLVLGSLGHVPQAGEACELFGWRFTVLAQEARRIRSVRIEPLSQPGEPDAERAAEVQAAESSNRALRVSPSDRGAS